MTPEFKITLCKAFALFSITAGGFGMLLCVPYIAGTNAIIIAAASLPFLAGAVLVAGGLISLSMLLEKTIPA